jgi:pimeloyl-ACP methyl ester carboxylesterase
VGAINKKMTKPLLHFAHANSYPAGTYRQFFELLGQDFKIQALDMHAHDPRYPVRDGWGALATELIDQLAARYAAPVILVGHSLGGMLSMMAAQQRPDLVRCVVLLDSPVLAGWRALFWRLLKHSAWADRYSPARFSDRRRNLWPDSEAVYSHYASKELFSAWAPGVLHDYIDSGLAPHRQGVQLRFTRENESAVYRSLPHHLGALVSTRYPVPIGFIGGLDSVESRQAGLTATRKLVGSHFRQIPGGHLFPMETPALAAQATREMIVSLLATKR